MCLGTGIKDLQRSADEVARRCCSPSRLRRVQHPLVGRLGPGEVSDRAEMDFARSSTGTSLAGSPGATSPRRNKGIAGAYPPHQRSPIRVISLPVHSISEPYMYL